MRPKLPSSLNWSDGVPLGRYVVYDRIASGGTASVHIAKLAGVGGFSRTVALKMLHEHIASDPKHVAMLLDEARLLSCVRHPNVVGTTDILEQGDVVALVMEYVLGAPLVDVTAKLVERGESIPVPIALAIAVHVLQGLGAAHDGLDSTGKPLQLVHRDVSPHNILIGVDGLARIIDFGIAQGATRLQNTEHGEVKGKLAYMAPEQVLGEPIDRRTDIFAVGVVLWEMLASTRLFFEKSEGHTVTNVLQKKIPSPMSGGFATRALSDVVLRSLERDPDRRFRTCAEMCEALEETMAIAKPRELSAWLGTVEPDTLAERRELLRHIESLPLPNAAPTSPRLSRMLAAVQEPSPSPPRVAEDRAPIPSETSRTVRRHISSSDAITQVRVGSTREIDEIRKLYESGDVTGALQLAKTIRVAERLEPTSILRVHLTPDELKSLPLDHRAGFMLTRIDGVSDMDTVLSVAGMPASEAIEILERLLTIGAVSVVGPSPSRAPQQDNPTLTRRLSRRDKA
jgi:serine/threonine protein kinase